MVGVGDTHHIDVLLVKKIIKTLFDLQKHLFLIVLLGIFIFVACLIFLLLLVVIIILIVDEHTTTTVIYLLLINLTICICTCLLLLYELLWRLLSRSIRMIGNSSRWFEATGTNLTFDKTVVLRCGRHCCYVRKLQFAAALLVHITDCCRLCRQNWWWAVGLRL